ncbi:hypothetical protein BDP27DRAFT_1360228 [Rhodocollybia butyracea]|uniref:BZIP domain-containing protein n=1 Tax=Rhodocollybia butyracea TaxID=206335 RepID=A0A9P5UC09_9AGAR|nr:hypothetical protein BDP27DRAFT_1360228 [Rhodocollybia butyracea]
MAKSRSPSPTPSASNMNVEPSSPSTGPPQPNYTHVSAETLSMRTTNRRERNRIASQKCRARKSARLTYLESRVAELEDEVRLLRSTLGASANAIPTTLGQTVAQGPPTPTLTPQSSLSSIASSSRSLSSLQSSSLASITSTSSLDTIPDMDVDQENMVEKLRLENETLKACMSKFEREWNAALSSLGINVPPKESASITAEPTENAPSKDGDASDASSQPLHSLATLIAAASHLTPQ